MGEVSKAKVKFPLGFYVCATTFSMERAAFYSSRFLLYAFLTATLAQGGLGVEDKASILQGNLVAYTYLAPIFGGYISDYWVGGRYMIPIGMFIMGAGYYVGSISTSVSSINLMIILVSVGTGFFKGNLSAVNGQQFADKDQLDSAFSVQYSFVNIGSFIGTTAVGILYLYTFAKNGVLGFSQCFLMAAILCVVGGIWFILGWPFLGDAGKRPFKEGVAKKVVEKSEKKPLTTIEKKRVLAIVLVSFFSVIFWIFWYISYLAVYDYAKYVNMFVGDFEVPIAWFDSLNAACCIILGPILAGLWVRLAKRPKGDLSLFKKTGLGMATLGVSFLMLIGAELSRGVGAPETVKASLIWIVLFGIILTLGEMFFSPLGNSFVSKYAPGRLLSVLMGVWIFSTFIAGKNYGILYNFTRKFNFMNVYITVIVVLIASAVVLFALDKKLSALVVEDEKEESQVV